MRIALLTLFSGALVAALSGEEAMEKYGSGKGWDKDHGGKWGKGGHSQVGNNIGNGNGGGINIDTGGGNVGDIGLGVGLGGGGTGGTCDQSTCNWEVRFVDIQRGCSY